MLFDKEVVAFEILDVFRVTNKRFSGHTRNRSFDALSLRFSADTVIRTGQGRHHLGDNAVTFFPAGVDYQRESKGDDLIVVHFNAFHRHGTDIESFVPAAPERYRALFAELLRVWRAKETGYQHRASAVLYEILAACYAECGLQEQEEDRLRAGVGYLDRHYQEHTLSLQMAAARCFMSEVYFRRLFKERYGISPKQYVIEKRMRRAAALIATGYYTVQEAAVACGYGDYKHFSTAFKKQMGVSPSDYDGK